MGQFGFTYELPSDFSSAVISFLRQEHRNDMVQAVLLCKFEYDDKGLTYHVGMCGDNWYNYMCEQMFR